MSLDVEPTDRPADGVAPRPAASPTRHLRLGTAVALAALVVSVVAGFTAHRLTQDDTGGSDAEVLLMEPRSILDNDPPPTGVPVPDVTFEGFHDGVEGSFADYAGTPLVVNFWASNCAPCIAEMPAFEQVHLEVADRVAFVGVNVTDPRGPAEQMLEQTGVTYDIVRDDQGRVFQAFGSFAMPTTVFVTAEGTVAEVHPGALTAEELRQRIERHLG